MPVVQGRDHQAQGVQERLLARVVRGGGQGFAQGRGPVGLDDVEIRIKVLEDVPGQGHGRQAGGAVFGREPGVQGQLRGCLDRGERTLLFCVERQGHEA